MSSQRERHRRIGALLPLMAASLMALQSGSARADRPLASETADAIEAGHCVVDSAARRYTASGEPSVSAWGGTLGCGLFGSTQMLLTYVNARSAGDSSQGLELGGKTNLVEVKEGQTGFGLVYAVGFAKSPGSGMRHETTRLWALASRELHGGAIVHANLGMTRSRTDDRTRGIWSLGVETTGDVSVAADVLGVSGSKPTLSAGMAYTFRPGWSVNATIAKELESPRGQELGIGLRIAF